MGEFYKMCFIWIAYSRSDKLKPFWLSMVDEDLSTFKWLCGALMSRELTDEYREAVSRSLDIPDCKVVPFFGGFLRDLRSLFINVPSIIVLPSEENQSLEVWLQYLCRCVDWDCFLVLCVDENTFNAFFKWLTSSTCISNIDISNSIDI